MGTNYYLVYNEKVDSVCPCCKHEITKYKELHLGKSSNGWTFALHVYPEQGIHTWGDVLYEILYATGKGGWIKDEYGTEVETDMFIDIVTERGSNNTIDEMVEKNNRLGFSTVEGVGYYLAYNMAVRGPNNLLRPKIGNGCIGHGGGTYDYLVGEFS